MIFLAPLAYTAGLQPQMTLQNDALAVVAQYTQGIWNLEIRIKTGDQQTVVLRPGAAQAGQFPAAGSGIPFSQCVVNQDTMTLTGTTGNIALTRKINVGTDGQVMVEDQFALGDPSQKVTQLGAVWTLSDSQTAIYTPGGKDYLPDTEFKTPFLLALGQNHDVLLTPDLSALSTGRPIPTVLAKSGPDSFSYGWGALDGTAGGGWSLSKTPRAFPGKASLKYSLRLAPEGTEMTPPSAARMLWTEWSKMRRNNPLPQTLPYWYMTKPIYSMQPTPDEKMLAPEGTGSRSYWWEGEIGDWKVGSASSQPRLEWGESNNMLRAAIGLRYWGNKLGQPSWRDRSDQMAALTLAGFDAVQGMPKSFRISNKSFERESDMTKAAATAVWLLRLSREPGFPYQEEAKRAINSIPLGPELTGLSSWRLALAAELTDDRSRLEDLAAVAMSQPERVNSFDAGLVEALAVLSEKLHKRELAAKAARLMEIYAINQAAWDMGHVSDMPLLGALGSDDLLDAEELPQAMLLLKVGELADDRVLFERGAIAQRSFVNLLYFNINAANGLALPSGTPVDRMSGGYSPDVFRGWAGFDKGEGQFLANAAIIDRDYGAFYRSDSGWAVGIDGLEANQKLEPVDLLARCPLPFGGHSTFEVLDQSNGRQAVDGPVFEPNVRALTIEWIDDEPHVVAHPGYVPMSRSTRPSGEFILADGTRLKAEVKAQGLAAPIRPSQTDLGPISFAGTMDGVSVDFHPTHLFIRPPLEPTVTGPRGWKRTGDLVGTGYPSLRLDNELAFSTADNGSGRGLSTLTGGFESPAFIITDSELSFRVQAARDCSIRLVDPLTGNVLRSYNGAAGQVETVIWDLTPFRGAKTVIRITDNSETGSIAVGSLSMQ